MTYERKIDICSKMEELAIQLSLASNLPKYVGASSNFKVYPLIFKVGTDSATNAIAVYVNGLSSAIAFISVNTEDNDFTVDVWTKDYIYNNGERIEETIKFKQNAFGDIPHMADRIVETLMYHAENKMEYSMADDWFMD